MMSKICGHRGAANHKPENTISGFEWCVENKIDWAECDVQLTNENTLLIIHDETLDRTSDNKGSIKKILKSDLNRINVGKLSEKDFYFQKIPTLTELLEFCKKTKLNLNIEMKFYGTTNKVVLVFLKVIFIFIGKMAILKNSRT